MKLPLITLSITQGLTAGFMLIVGLLTGLTFIGNQALVQTKNALETVVTNDAVKVGMAARMVQNLIALQRAEKNLILSRSHSEMDEYEKVIETIDFKLREQKQILDSTVDNEGRQILDQFRVHYENYRQAQNDIVNLTRKNSNTEARTLSQGIGAQTFDKIHNTIMALVNANRDKSKNTLKDVFEVSAEKIRLMAAIQHLFMLTNQSQSQLLLNNVEKAKDKIQNLHLNSFEALDNNLQELQRLLSKEENVLIKRFLKIRHEYENVGTKLKDLYRKHDQESIHSQQIMDELFSLGTAMLHDLLRKIHKQFEKYQIDISRSIESVHLGGIIQINLNEIHRVEKDLILSITPNNMKKYATRTQHLVNSIKDHITALKKISNQVNVARLSEFSQLFERLLATNKSVIAKSLENANRRAFNISSGKARKYLNDAENMLNKLVKKNDSDMEKALQNAKNTYKSSRTLSFAIAVLAVLASIIIGVFIKKLLISKVSTRVKHAHSIAMGSVLTTCCSDKDELSAIDDALNAISENYQTISDMAIKAMQGDFSGRLSLRHKDDHISQAINQIIHNMEVVIEQAHSISTGHFDIEIVPRSEHDRLSIALGKMTMSLKAADIENKRQRWMQDGIVKLNDAMRGRLDPPELAKNILKTLCTHLQALIGLLYLTVEHNQEDVIQLIGSHAAPPKENIISSYRLGEGLIGETLLHGEIVIIDNIVDSAIKLSSGFCELHPSCLVVAPFHYEKEPRGVIQLAFMHSPNSQELEFLKKVMSTISIGFETAQARPLAKALQESKTLALKLQDTNKKLTKQSQALEKAHSELSGRNRSLQEAQLELTQQAEQLKRSYKYKSDFLATMSHEIRTPMNGILGTVQLLERTSLDQQQHVYVDTISRSGKSLLAIIGDILDLSKIESGKLKIEYANFEIASFLSGIESTVSTQVLEKQLDFQIRVADDVPETVCSDVIRLRQILLNLVSNAIKFSDSGLIIVQVEAKLHDVHGGDNSAMAPIPRSGDVHRGTKSANGDAESKWLSFTVIDAGIGISPEMQAQLFQPFVQANTGLQRQSIGAGLGLSICKQLVQALGGNIGLKSVENEGSTFWFTVPMIAAHTDENHLLPSTQPINALPTQLNILLVEDEATNQMVGNGLLQLLGANVTNANSGEQALSVVKDKDFDMILMDIKMAGLNGWETTQRIRKLEDANKATVPIIAMTAFAMQDDIAYCYEVGMDAFIAKPLEIDKLFKVIQSIGAADKVNPPALHTSPNTTVTSDLKEFNPIRLENMAKDLSPEWLDKIIQACNGSVVQSYQDLMYAWQNRDFQALTVIAHKLYGAAATNGLEVLCQHTMLLEKAARNTDASKLDSLMQETKQLVDKTLEKLTKWNQEYKSSASAI